MLSPENSDRLIAVRGGTPCGDWLRCFWFPIAISDHWTGLGAQLRLAEPMTYRNRVGTPTSFGQEQINFTGKPLRVQLLGEELALYRDLSGRLGLLGIDCPHRRSSFEYGRPREHGLACAYHGWTFDEGGTCLAMPGEPRDSSFKDKVRQTAYPVRELGGLIWAWLGKGEAPALPLLDVIAREDGVRIVENFCLWPAHWLQIVENSVDQVHTGILHGEESARADVWSTIPEVDWVADAHGIQTVQIRGGYRRTNYLRLPTTILLNQPWPGGRFDWPRYSAIFRTPVDENNTLLIHVTFVPDVNGQKPILPQGMDFPVANLVETLFLQDYRAVVSQGRPFDRTKERLGTTDRGVIMLRKMIMEGIDAVAAGKDPNGVLRGSAGAAILNSAEKVTDGLMSVRAAE
jgi:5,5'-dehydrodivanillate O-demethylase oxygenase subunit